MKTVKMISLALLLAIFTSCGTLNGNSEIRFKEIYKKANYSIHFELLTEYKKQILIIQNGALVVEEETVIGYSRLSGFVIKLDNNFYVLSAGHIQNEKTKILGITAYFNVPIEPQTMEILGYDPLLDASLLKFTNPNFKFTGQTAELGDSQKLEALDPVLAIGSQYGTYAHAPTIGHIIKIEGASADYSQPEMIFHNAVINPGNSGGPLLNDEGKVIGINLMILTEYSNQFTPLYVAVPINYVKAVLPQLQKGGQVEHAYLPGIYFSNQKGQVMVSERKTNPNNLKINIFGLATDDIIVSYDGKTPKNNVEITEYIAFQKKPGEKIDFVIKRNGQKLNLSVYLQKYEKK